MGKEHERAYQVLMQVIKEAQLNGRKIDIGKLKQKVIQEAGTIEIAPGRTIFDYLKVEEEWGNIEKRGNTYIIKKDIIIFKK